MERRLVTRRSFTGALAVAAVASVAGCGDPEDDPEEDPGVEDEEVHDEDEDPEEEPEEEAPDEEDEPEEEEEEEPEADAEAIDPGEEIQLDGATEAWIGVAPDAIADEENPTLTLQEGEAYSITWENVDGVAHNIEIWDENDDLVGDYETELMDEEGDTQTLDIDEVTDEMAYYVCEPHQGTMRGEIEVVDANGDDEDEEPDEEAEEEEVDNGEENDEEAADE